MSANDYPFDRILDQYPGIMETLDRIVTGEAYFRIFQQLSDNYSPTLTVGRVQGPLVEQILAGHHSIVVGNRSLAVLGREESLKRIDAALDRA